MIGPAASGASVVLAEVSAKGWPVVGRWESQRFRIGLGGAPVRIRWRLTGTKVGSVSFRSWMRVAADLGKATPPGEALLRDLIAVASDTSWGDTATPYIEGRWVLGVRYTAYLNEGEYAAALPMGAFILSVFADWGQEAWAQVELRTVSV